MRKLLLIVVMGTVVSFIGCASMTTIQTAETLDPGKMTYYVAYVPSHLPLLDTNSDGEADMMAFNTIEGGARVGVTDRIDLGAKLYPVGLVFDGKYQFLKGEKLKGAGDLGFGYMTITSGSAKTTLIDFVPQVPLTYRPFSWCALTVTPKSLIRIAMASDDSTNESSSASQFLFGGTGGVKFTVGKLGSMIFEYGKFGGAYTSDHFAIAVEKPFNYFNKED